MDNATFAKRYISVSSVLPHSSFSSPKFVTTVSLILMILLLKIMIIIFFLYYNPGAGTGVYYCDV
jgi:hypothetical protein